MKFKFGDKVMLVPENFEDMDQAEWEAYKELCGIVGIVTEVYSDILGSYPYPYRVSFPKVRKGANPNGLLFLEKELKEA